MTLTEKEYSNHPNEAFNPNKHTIPFQFIESYVIT